MGEVSLQWFDPIRDMPWLALCWADDRADKPARAARDTIFAAAAGLVKSRQAGQVGSGTSSRCRAGATARPIGAEVVGSHEPVDSVGCSPA